MGCRLRWGGAPGCRGRGTLQCSRTSRLFFLGSEWRVEGSKGRRRESMRSIMAGKQDKECLLLFTFYYFPFPVVVPCFLLHTHTHNNDMDMDMEEEEAPVSFALSSLSSASAAFPFLFGLCCLPAPFSLLKKDLIPLLHWQHKLRFLSFSFLFFFLRGDFFFSVMMVGGPVGGFFCVHILLRRRHGVASSLFCCCRVAGGPWRLGEIALTLTR